MKIYFVGYLKSPFIRQNLALLQEDHEVLTFDLSQHATSFSQVPRYILDVFGEWDGISSSDVLWLWFADYPAIPFVAMARLMHKPVAVNVGGWEVYAAPEVGYGNQLSTVRGAATRWILRNASVAVCMSEAYRKIIEEVEPHATVRVVPGRIDTALCSEPLLDDKHGVVTAYCSYNLAETIKGIPIFTEATQGMDSVILKDVPHKRLIGSLQHAKVYCQLSYTESFGITLLEAMACGCVPVVSDRDALPEVVGGVGVVVPYGDASKTRDAITDAIDMDGGNARKRAMVFSRENAKAKIEQLLKEVCV